jgi:hypothetical protein
MSKPASKTRKPKFFIAPPFDPGSYGPEIRYHWWSWSPDYPWWSKSCWGGDTEKEAWEALESPLACKMKYYHNKLIREGDGKLTEVADLPCLRHLVRKID